MPFSAPTGRKTHGPVSQDMASILEFTNRVINGDCIKVLPKLPDRSVDFVLTDPPYFVRYRDRAGRSVANDDNEAWLKPAFAEIYRVLKNNKFCVSFYGWNKADKFFAAWKDAGFKPVGHLIWVKSYASSQGFLRYHHEQAYLLAKGDPPKPRTLLSHVINDWQYTGNPLHPTQKPVGALLPLISTFSQRKDVVLDPFCGSGSTLLAAKLLDRRYVGIEMVEEYSKAAQNRL